MAVRRDFFVFDVGTMSVGLGFELADAVVAEFDGEFADGLVEFDDFVGKIFSMGVLFVKINELVFDFCV